MLEKSINFQSCAELYQAHRLRLPNLSFLLRISLDFPFHSILLTAKRSEFVPSLSVFAYSLHCSVSFPLIYIGVMWLGAFRFDNILSSYWKKTSVIHKMTRSPVMLRAVGSILLGLASWRLWSVCTVYCASWLFIFFTWGAWDTVGVQWTHR